MLTARSRLAARSPCTRLMGRATHLPIGRHPPIAASRANGQRTQAGDPFFYDREDERKQLDLAVKERPRDILVLLGPPNCGKTAIIKAFLKDKPHVVYIDCRGIDSLNPATFITGLLKQLQPLAPGFLQGKLAALLYAFTADVKVSSAPVTWSPAAFLKFLFGQEQAASASKDLNDVFETLEKIFAAWAKEAQPGSARDRPVLIIDEANDLMSWSDKHADELHNLLSFFVRITKQEGLCHVILATADFGYQTWLDSAIGQGRSQSEVIGDFLEKDARGFFCQLLVGSSCGNRMDKDEEAWAAVYKVCGGNAGALARLANRLQRSSTCDWKGALEALWESMLDGVTRLMRGGKGYTAVQYAAAATALLDSQQRGNAVGKQDMEALLGRYVEGAASTTTVRVAGAAVLQCLVQANALSVRRRSAWARDIPVEAFGSNGAVVTAPSTMELYCMGLIRSELDEVLKEHDSMQVAKQMCALGNLRVGASPSSSPGAGPHNVAERRTEEPETEIRTARDDVA